MNDFKIYCGQALVTLSYDDGRLDNYEIAIPLHRKYGITASFSIIAERLMNSKRWHKFMAPWQVCEADSLGFEMVSHSYNHKKLTEMSGDELVYELVESKNFLAGFLKGGCPKTICIPFSSSEDYILEEAKKHYDLVRIHGAKFNEIHDGSKIIYSHGLRTNTDFNQIKNLIDIAVEEKKWLVLMLHGVLDDEVIKQELNISSVLLEQILQYIAQQGQDKILPITFDDALKIRGILKNQNLATDNTKIIYSADSIDNNQAALSEASMPSVVIESTPGYMITYHPGKIKEKLIISFGGMPSKKKKKGFGSEFIMKQGYDHIFVAQEEGTQYQELSLEQFKKAVAPYIKDKDVYTYGSSLGGYCAVYYGGCINARIISAAPKNSAHPDYVKPRFQDFKFQHTEIIDNPISNKPPIILFDPHREEETTFIHEKIAPAYPHAIYVEMPFAGHTVLHTMLESGVLKTVIKSIIDTGYPCEFSLMEEGSYIWHAEKGRFYFNKNQLNLAMPHLLRSIELNLNKDAVNLLLKIYYKKKEMEKGKKLIELYDKTYGIKNSIYKNLLVKFGYA